MSKDGKRVWCTSGADGAEVDHILSRTLCLADSRPGCATCSNASFSLVFQIRVADQMVACPRWVSEEDLQERRDPLGYVPTQRAICLNIKPFDFCFKCPNSSPGNSPRVRDRWFEEEERARKIELELEEEERE